MKQFEAVIKIMEKNGGYATLGFLNQEVFKIKDCEWKTKTPFASIRRIVQDKRYFFKIRPGLWALNAYRDKLPAEIFPSARETQKKLEEYTHTYYQGLLVEIGNLRHFQTFVPKQDKNKLYLGKKISEIASLSDIYSFTYDKIVQKAKTVDVIWFNERNMPSKLFEIEHSTDIYKALLKFVELQDFYISFFIVANAVREIDFNNKLSYSAFSGIRKRIKFLSYDQLSDWHTKTFQITIIENSIGI